MLRMAIGLTAVLAPLQLIIGDQHGLNTLKYQPIKIAAMEAHWDGTKPADFHIFAWPDEKAGKNDFAISIPNGASLILTHRLNGLFKGLNSVPASEPAARRHRLLRLPHHAGARFLHDRGGALRRLPVVARHAVYDALVSRGDGAMLVGRLRRGDCRLGRHRERAPALGRARHLAHRRRQLAGAGRQRRADAGAVRHRLRRRVLVRHLLHQPADRARHGRAHGRSRQALSAARPSARRIKAEGGTSWNGISP